MVKIRWCRSITLDSFLEDLEKMTKKHRKHRVRWSLVRAPFILSSDEVENFTSTFKEYVDKRYCKSNLPNCWDSWLKDTDNWSKSYLSHIVFHKLCSKLFPSYTVLPLYELYPLRFLESCSSARESMHSLIEEDEKLILKVRYTFDFVGYKIINEKVIDKCFIELKSISFRSFKVNRSPSLSRSQRRMIPEAIHKGFNVYVVMFVYLPNRRIKVFIKKAFIETK